jgi:integrase
MSDETSASPNCKMYHPQFFSDCWGRLVEQSGLPPIRLHDGHHEAESLAPAVGVALKAMQAILRHSPTRMTTRAYQTGAAQVARREGLSLLGPHRHTPGSE